MIDVVVITCPGGTYMLIGEPYGANVIQLENYPPQELLEDIKTGNVPLIIQKAYNYFYEIFQIVSG